MIDFEVGVNVDWLQDIYCFDDDFVELVDKFYAFFWFVLFDKVLKLGKLLICCFDIDFVASIDKFI